MKVGHHRPISGRFGRAPTTLRHLMRSVFFRQIHYFPKSFPNGNLAGTTSTPGIVLVMMKNTLTGSHTAAPQTHPQDEDASLTCPRCGAGALNKNGHIKSGKQRYLCLVCNRQFVIPSAASTLPFRPHCDACGRPMHVYARDDRFIRFRCSGYPACRSYRRIEL